MDLIERALPTHRGGSKSLPGGSTSVPGYPYPSGTKSKTGRASRSFGTSLPYKFPTKVGAASEEAQPWIRTLQPLLSMAIFFNFMVILGLIFFAMATAMKAQRHKADYKFHREPSVLDFDEIAVISNAQECNDMARMLAVENYSLNAIALGMQICMMSAEPERGGLGGSSTVVYVDLNAENRCRIIDVFDSLRESFIAGYRKSSQDKINVPNCLFKKLQGKSFGSIALPGELVTAAWFASKMLKEEIQTPFLLFTGLRVRKKFFVARSRSKRQATNPHGCYSVEICECFVCE
ncbi:unnamed protein product [Cylicocyclus nassatus]|uniref:Uncharacterized protein n=1 Tax=Cylicocyclus nassatus TaxID=53992 RepID=A0AA36DJA0_CYLNA|nr:unnamed protein product [Cylicocyclus nassatus]